jgi:adenylylsulfate reductase, subunit A
MAQFETVEVSTDLLICGGGMAACGAAVEAAYWAKKQGLKVTMVDKATPDRSGAVAMGLSAINTYMGVVEGENTPEGFVKYVRGDLMGITREDLVYDIGRHVDGTVNLFEKWGLPFWRDHETGKRVRGGKWQIMINGESYKVIVAEAAKNALAEMGDKGEVIDRVFILEPLLDGDRIAGAVGFSVRENKIYVFKAKAVMAAMGGAVGVFRPRSVGEGLGRSWYPPFSSGSSAYFTIKAGAEMTCQEVRFIPVRFKDGYGPVGAWFLFFKAKAKNALGEDYMVTNAAELEKWGPYGKVKPVPANLRNWLGMLDVNAGKGPIYMHTPEAMAAFGDAIPDEKARKKRMKELEAEAWEDYLDMTVSQALLWAGENIRPEDRPSEIAGAEPYFIGSHSGASGAWCSGPEDLAPKEYFWGYNRMTTVKGLFAAGDACGASSHKFSSGSHAEGRIAAKAAVAFIVDNPSEPKIDKAQLDAIIERINRPMKLFEENHAKSSDPNINPAFMKPRQYMHRIQKIMDEYAGGYSCAYTTSAKLMEKGLEKLAMLKEDSEKLAAENLHELMRCFENIHRTAQAEVHIRTMLFREETRWPGYYFRSDIPTIKDPEWRVFVNIAMDPKTGEYSLKKIPVIELVK